MTKELLRKANELEGGIFYLAREVERCEKTLAEIQADKPENIEVVIRRRWSSESVEISGLNPSELIEQKIALMKKEIQELEKEFNNLQ